MSADEMDRPSVRHFHDTGIHYGYFLAKGVEGGKAKSTHRLCVVIPGFDLRMQPFSCSALVRKTSQQKIVAITVGKAVKVSTERSVQNFSRHWVTLSNLPSVPTHFSA